MRLPRLLAVILLLAACTGPAQQAPVSPTAASQPPPQSVALTSTAFAEGGTIPRKYTCDGANVSPPLAWSVPSTAKSLALIADDPDAPLGTWTHWVVFNLPAGSTGLPEGIGPQESPGGRIQATTSFGKTGYGGPCPPGGTPATTSASMRSMRRCR